ncbi:DUF937 domain-containing protein [Jejubacter calystegiae]|uniref:DUF937 domain-containing protein n=1 Tax=Jejubacter calystegiae TaxID=2579935 RepID=A0A4P8YHX9_9ENTR|nr:YidB family protein [Jejubacter calystegiae]QCT19184.1 DUF937 domain-containing protein [Jejubacter calystegiae]
MGLLDQVTGMLGGGQGGEASKFQAILSWVNEQGGVQAILDKFRQGGLASVVESWISSSMTNQSISAGQIQDVLGSPAIGALASKLGIDAGKASSLLAEYLPQIVDKLSPEGEVKADNGNDLLAKGFDLLKGKLFS